MQMTWLFKEKLLELTRPYSNITGYKINLQKSQSLSNILAKQRNKGIWNKKPLFLMSFVLSLKRNSQHNTEEQQSWRTDTTQLQDLLKLQLSRWHGTDKRTNRLLEKNRKPRNSIHKYSQFIWQRTKGIQ